MPNWTDTAPEVDVPCPLCNEGVRRRIVETVWDGPDSAVYQCTGCEVVFVYPILTEEQEKAFYEQEFAAYMRQRGAPGETVPEEHFRKNQPEADRRLKNLKPILHPEMDVLELGSATGSVLAALRPRVKSVTGIEPGRNYAEYANSVGLTTHANLDEVSGRKFDLICAYYVVEHLRDPVGLLSQLRGLLQSGGVLAIEVPNVDDALVRFYALEAFDRFYWQKAHYFNYSHRTLARVLKSAGFSEIDVIPEHRYDFSNHLHWIWKGQPGGKGKYSDVFDSRLDAEYARCLKERWLCDTVFALARK